MISQELAGHVAAARVREGETAVQVEVGADRRCDTAADPQGRRHSDAQQRRHDTEIDQHTPLAPTAMNCMTSLEVP